MPCGILRTAPFDSVHIGLLVPVPSDRYERYHASAPHGTIRPLQRYHLSDILNNPTVEETLGEYSVEYLNENYLYIGGEKFDVIFTGKNSLTLKSEKIIISITN